MHKNANDGHRYNHNETEGSTKLLSKVKWGDEEAQNTWKTKYAYLGSMSEAGGTQMPDVRITIARVRQRHHFGEMRHIWGNRTLHENLRKRLYKSSVCSVTIVRTYIHVSVQS